MLPSHFDYENQALFYVPPDLPDARTPQFTALAAERIRKLLEITRGRAFVLFTSYAQMNDIYQRLLGELEFPMLKQGDAPKSALLEEFRLTPNAVLFATSSFWQGVDVQGEQLSCVIIDRLPFAVPSDPVVAARIKAIDADGGNAFFQYQVPAAVITLKQGFGRLIRSLHDRGLLVLLDNRILKKQYGRVFIESLPNYKKTTDVRVVEEFFGAGTLDNAVAFLRRRIPPISRLVEKRDQRKFVILRLDELDAIASLKSKYDADAPPGISHSSSSRQPWHSGFLKSSLIRCLQVGSHVSPAKVIFV